MNLQMQALKDFCVNKENKIISSIITYVKNLSAGSVHQLQEADNVEMLNTDAPVVHCLSDDKTAEMVLNTNKHEDDENDDGDKL
jgi:hypothetical protein